MQTTIRGKNVSVAEADRRYVEQKLRRLERMLDERSEVGVELREEHVRNADEAYVAEVTLVIDGRSVRSEGSGPTYRAAIDGVIDRLERRTVEHKQRPRDRARSAEGRLDPALGSESLPSSVEGSGDARVVVKVKRFAIEPMFEEDAVARMEELGHAFFVFVNAENERIGILYRRRDGRYGLIEPSIPGQYTTARR
ncbi:ribosome-associated translation inhibitor RaiA [soil metagenome]